MAEAAAVALGGISVGAAATAVPQLLTLVREATAAASPKPRESTRKRVKTAKAGDDR
jgi:hypothetical protein